MKQLFSHRKGLLPFPSQQKEEWDRVTMNLVWDVLEGYVIQVQEHYDHHLTPFIVASLKEIHSELFEKPLCDFEDFHSRFDYLKHNGYFSFYFDADYNRRLDFIELFISGDGNIHIRKHISDALNAVFEDRLVAYRIIDGQVTDIDRKEEREAVEQAADKSSHISKAIKLMYNRESPDYENAVKESILAVEEICREIIGNPKGTLANCLRVIDDKIPMHPAFQEALTKLYGYTSDRKGVRHAGDGGVDFAEAQFMLVTCSAFCNYLRAQQAKM